MADIVDLTIQSLSGEDVASLKCHTSSTVYDVKQRLAQCTEANAAQHQLVYGCNAMEDRRTLASYGVNPPTALLQCVRLRPSGLALYLKAQSESTDQEEVMLASLSDVADSVMRAEHEQSERYKPRAADLSRGMSPQARNALISWMVDAFEALQFTDDILHSCVLTLDRYYAQCESQIELLAMQKVLLSVLCTELKLQSVHNGKCLYWQQLIGHLCQGRLGLPAVMKMEMEVLSSLKFVVAVPTPLNFLHGLGIRLQEGTSTSEAQRWLSIALFLLELAMFEPALQYGYDHAVLAAGAVGAALQACAAPSSKHEYVLEDLAAYCPTLSNAQETVDACEEELLTLWLRSSTGESGASKFYAQLDAKFGSLSRHAVSRLSPDHALRRHQASSPQSTPQNSSRSSSSVSTPSEEQASLCEASDAD